MSDTEEDPKKEGAHDADAAKDGTPRRKARRRNPGNRRRRARRRRIPQGIASSGESSTHQMSELKQLGELHEQGVLTDEEFEAQKKKILTTL